MVKCSLICSVMALIRSLSSCNAMHLKKLTLSRLTFIRMGGKKDTSECFLQFIGVEKALSFFRLLHLYVYTGTGSRELLAMS